MGWLQSIIYGFIMGFCELVPISSSAQELILQRLFGIHGNDALCDLLVHTFSLLAFLVAWRGSLAMFREHHYVARNRRGRHGAGHHGLMDSIFIKSAIIPMFLCMILSLYFAERNNVMHTVFILLLNGIILYLPERLLQGNKTARSMSVLDSWLLGIASGASVIPGFSRIGMGIAVSQMRGADKKNALTWAYMLSIPALLLLIGADIISLIFSGGATMFSTGFGGYLLISICSFAGCYLAVYLIRSVILLHGLRAFAYYSWGAALFLFILYLL